MAAHAGSPPSAGEFKLRLGRSPDKLDTTIVDASAIVVVCSRGDLQHQPADHCRIPNAITKPSTQQPRCVRGGTVHTQIVSRRLDFIRRATTANGPHMPA